MLSTKVIQQKRNAFYFGQNPSIDIYCLFRWNRKESVYLGAYGVVKWIEYYRIFGEKQTKISHSIANHEHNRNAFISITYAFEWSNDIHTSSHMIVIELFLFYSYFSEVFHTHTHTQNPYHRWPNVSIWNHIIYSSLHTALDYRILPQPNSLFIAIESVLFVRMSVLIVSKMIWVLIRDIYL